MRPKKRTTQVSGTGEKSPPALKRPQSFEHKRPKILVIDIETAPIVALVWKIWEENVGLEQIVHDSSILSFGAKWLGDSKMIYHDTSGRGADRARDDLVLMQPLWDLLHEADIVVAQNGQAFDLKRIDARLIKHGFPPYSPIKQVDTLLSARRRFKFTSNKLEWMAQQLTDARKSKHHKFPGFELWLECLKDNPEAWKEMRKYNLLDVTACEKVYLRLVPWTATHPNIAVGAGHCPACGKGKTVAIGRHTMPSGIAYARLWCESCGHWSRGKKMLQPIEERRQMPVSIP